MDKPIFTEEFIKQVSKEITDGLDATYGATVHPFRRYHHATEEIPHPERFVFEPGYRKEITHRITTNMNKELDGNPLIADPEVMLEFRPLPDPGTYLITLKCVVSSGEHANG